MAFPSLSSGWDPLWKGLGFETKEELAPSAPSSFDSEFDNSIKKRVSFASPMSNGKDKEREKNQKWTWRRKGRSKGRGRRRMSRRANEEAPTLDEYSGDSLDSSEVRTIEQRDDYLDGDFWGGSDTRDHGNENFKGLWSALFPFGDDEKAFDDGWTEVGSSIFSVTTETSRSEDGTIDSLSNEEVRRGKSTSAEEREEIEFANRPDRSSKSRSEKEPIEEEREKGSRSCLGAGIVEVDTGDGTFSPNRFTVNFGGLSETDEAADLDKRPPDTLPSSKQEIGDQNSTPEALDAVYKPSDHKKKKKSRWKVSRAMAEKVRVKSSRKTTTKLSPPSRAVEDISQDHKDESLPPSKTKYNVDVGEGGIAHKSCVPVLFGERRHRNKEPIGKLLCQSQKSLFQTHQRAALVNSDSISHATSQATSTQVPLVRIVSDTQGNQGPVIGTTRSHQSDIHQQMQLQESLFTATKGPQSIYTYEYESGTHMDVCYKKFGYHPGEVMSVREYNFPLTVFPGTDDVVIMVEASTISLSDCRIRQGQWWGCDPSPLPNCPGVDMIGKIHSIDDKSRRKYRFNPGDRVMSLVGWGGNSRYIRLKADQLVKAPKTVDPAEAVCLAEVYLGAFQALQYTQSSWARYSSQSLIGKSVLVVNGTTNAGYAVIELAIALGAMEVFATGKKRHFDHLKELGATPLDRKPKLWPREIVGMIDIVIDATGDVEGEHANVLHFKALHEQGCLIFIGLRDMTDAVAREWDVTSTLLKEEDTDDLVNRTHSLEVFDNWELDLERSKNDLDYLLRLLEQELIKPIVRDVLPLAKVARAQELLETKRVDGFLVCEPWIKSKSRAVYL